MDIYKSSTCGKKISPQNEWNFPVFFHIQDNEISEEYKLVHLHQNILNNAPRMLDGSIYKMQGYCSGLHLP